MKRFTVPCDFGEAKAPLHIYIGHPLKDSHPLRYQAAWVSEERGGTIPQDVMDSFARLHAIAEENRVSFEDLCVYALGQTHEAEPPESGGAPPGPA